MSVSFLDMVVFACLALCGAGCIYALVAGLLLHRFAARIDPSPSRFPGITILKPLRGAEVGLYDSLASFCRQDYPAPIQIICGLSDAHDPAAEVVRRLVTDFPNRELTMIIDPSAHGANAKLSNLINMASSIRHEVIVLADSDIRVEPGYLGRLMGQLERPGVGMVTCLYRGVPFRGIWSRLSARAINHHFLPSVLVGLRVGRAQPCCGATMAFTTATLRQIGGFEAFANHLADDYAMGAAVRRTGSKVVLSSMIVTHVCQERSASELLRQELRWARTLRLLDPAGFSGSAVTHALPFALIALALAPGAPSVQAAVCLVLLFRMVLQIEADRVIGVTGNSWLLGPMRDLLSFVVFVASHFTDAVSWRGQRYRVRRDGTLVSAEDMAS
jgi:ceramide glucosyltransferase